SPSGPVAGAIALRAGALNKLRASARRPPTRRQGPPTTHLHKRRLNTSGSASRSEGSVQNLSHFRLAERHPALAHAVMAPLICWSFSNSMFRYFLVDHAVPAMWRSLAAARLSAD